MGKKRQGMTDYIYIMQELRHIYFGENIYFSKMVILFLETYLFFEENYLMFAFWNLLKNCTVMVAFCCLVSVLISPRILFEKSQ